MVWVQSNDQGQKVFKREYRNGIWSAAESLTAAAGTISGPGQGAIDNDGNMIVAWRQSDGTNEQVFKSEYRNGAWTHPADLSDNISPEGQDANSPQVAMDDNSNAIVVWNQSDGSNLQVFKSEYRNGTWTNPSGLSDNISPDGQDAGSPQVAMDDNGNAVVIWSQSDGSNLQIFKSEYRNGTWTNPSGLSDNISPDGQDADSYRVAMDDNGNAIVVWLQSDGSDDQIFKSEYRNGAWSHPSGLSDNISSGIPGEYFIFMESPVVAMSNNGDAIIAWPRLVYESDREPHAQLFEGMQARMFMSRYSNGAWTHPDDIGEGFYPDYNPDETDILVFWMYKMSLDMDGHGNALLVWSQRAMYAQGTRRKTFLFKSELRDGAWTHPDSLDESFDFCSANEDDINAVTAAISKSGTILIATEQWISGVKGLYVTEYSVSAEDTDGDGMSDCYENSHGLKPDFNDAADDLDGDGILNAVEYHSGCMAADKADTDGDGLLDNEEDVNLNGHVNSGESDPCDFLSPSSDTDGDGMPNSYEVAHGLDPLVDDTLSDKDSDGLTNWYEYQSGTLDPDNPDSDGDQMWDGWEVKYGFDPLIDDAGGDEDSDGFLNLEEFQGGSEPDNYDSLPQGYYRFDYDLNGNMVKVY